MRQWVPWGLVVVLGAVLLAQRGLPRPRAEAGEEAPAGPAAYEKGWAVWEVGELRKRQKASGKPYLPFLNVPTMYCGLYALPAKGKDGQSPHRHDEVYYVLRGSAKIQTGSGGKEETAAVREGSVIFIKAGVEHRFVDITEDLELLVFFSSKDPPGAKKPG